MEYADLCLVEKKSYTVPEIRKMLGLGKTESYWLLKHRSFKTMTYCGQIRVDKESFDDWYDNQVKYKLVDGPEPGKKLRSYSYSPQEAAGLLGISDTQIYLLITRGCFETIEVDSRIRILKDSFDRWYGSQSIRRTLEDQKADAEATKECYSLPEIRKMLGVHRNTIYDIISSKTYAGQFDVVVVAGRKYVTKASFHRWYAGQHRYHIQEIVDSDSSARQTETPVNAQNKKKNRPSMTRLVPHKKNYSVDDVSVLTGIKAKKIYAMIQRFEINAIKVGTKYYVPANTLKELLKERSCKDGDDN